MITFDEALSAVLASAAPLPSMRIALEDALGYVLSEPVATPHDLPLFDNSAVDGFGVYVGNTADASEGSPVRLELEKTIWAGDDASGFTLTAGKAVKILTGAPVPAGVEAVTMREYCREQGDEVEFARNANPGENIRLKGEEFRAGQQVLEANTRITPAVVGMLATLGRTAVDVYRKPRVTVIVTGDELVKPGVTLRPGQIYESNSFAVVAILRELGITDVEQCHLPDDREVITKGLRTALASSDVLVTVGGVSVGDRDYVKAAFADLGVEQVFWKIKMKPGMPNYLGIYKQDDASKTLVFGLPGNPVSAQISFHHLVRPAILKLMGVARVEREGMLAELTIDIRHKPGRREFIRGSLELNRGCPVVRPLSKQGSHMQGGLAMANCLIDVPADCAELKKGTQVFVELLSWR